MTANQLAYLNLMEQQRKRISELAETRRSNLAKEAETNRSNLAKEKETNRANTMNEVVKIGELVNKATPKVLHEVGGGYASLAPIIAKVIGDDVTSDAWVNKHMKEIVKLRKQGLSDEEIVEKIGR